MGTFGHIVSLATTAVAAYMIGYHYGPGMQKPCSVVSTDWKSDYTTQMQKIESVYEKIPVTPGVAARTDLEISYVISENPSFKGLIYTDTASGKSGIITKNDLIGEKTYNMQPTSLDTILSSASIKTSVPITTAVKTQSGSNMTPAAQP